LEVRAAAGGQESQLFTMELFNMYSAYAEMKDWEWETLAVSDSEVGGYRVPTTPLSDVIAPHSC
jgi:peptide chain release factor 1